jgi:hypothetical protein
MTLIRIIWRATQYTLQRSKNTTYCRFKIISLSCLLSNICPLILDTKTRRGEGEFSLLKAERQIHDSRCCRKTQHENLKGGEGERKRRQS